jgi:tripartite-type tricarboxylate transporter receptor subunit TctC
MKAIIKAMAMGAALAAASFGLLRTAQANDFYAGKTIRLITGGNAGGGYDTHSRLLANFMTKHIPGRPDIVVQNMPEGSGMGAANYVFNVSKKDGTEIGQFNRDALILALLGDKAARFTIDGFIWLGTPADYSQNVFIAAIRGSFPFKSFDDVRNAKDPLNFGNTGTVLPYLVRDALGANIKVIEGYKGDIFLAMARGEIDGMVTSYATAKLANADMLAKGTMRVIVQFGRDTRLPELPDAPTAMELARTPADRELMNFFEVGLHMGFPFAVPPGVPADRVKILRDAFRDTMKDPEYEAAVRKTNLEFSPVDGEHLTEAIRKAVKTSPETVARYKALAAGGGR